MKVMLVDDSRFFRKTCKSEIENGGYNVIEAPGGPESLSIMKDHKIDLIILDIEMPRMNGLETCEKIRNLKDKNEANIPIVFFTSKDTIEHRKRGFELGATDFLSKDFEAGELLLAINKVLKPDTVFEDFHALLISNNAAFLNVIPSLLEKEGLKVYNASDTHQGLSLFDENPEKFDLIFVDKDSVGDDPKILLDTIRKKLGFSLVPINILTDAFFEDEEMMYYIGHGATDYFSKPIIKEVFLSRIRSQLRSYGVQKNLIVSMKQLKEIGELKDAFLEVFSNDMLTPLKQIIKNNHEVLQGLQDQKFLPLIKENDFLSNFVLNQFKNLLVLRKIELNEDFKLIKFNIEEIINKFIENKKKEIKSRGLVGEFKISIDEERDLLMDPAAIERALNTTTYYALENAERGSTVSVHGYSSGREDFLYEVNYKGEGIDPKVLQQILVQPPSELIKDFDKVEDPSFGLVLVNYIVKHHFGEFKYSEKDDGHINISFTLPLNKIK